MCAGSVPCNELHKQPESVIRSGRRAVRSLPSAAHRLLGVQGGQTRRLSVCLSVHAAGGGPYRRPERTVVRWDRFIARSDRKEANLDYSP